MVTIGFILVAPHFHQDPLVSVSKSLNFPQGLDTPRSWSAEGLGFARRDVARRGWIRRSRRGGRAGCCCCVGGGR
uniref:Uncharacterized protein n=1 Tax=Arundo donax TaxID=35708 RepID=A0A0A9ERD9_ARUDO